jgi:hypothetical protein
VNDPDEIIERALHRLRDAEPASDFEQRLLASLRKRTEAQQPTPSLYPFGFSRLLFPSRLSLSVLVLLVSLGVGVTYFVRQRDTIREVKSPAPSTTTAHIRHEDSALLPASKTQNASTPAPFVSRRSRSLQKTGSSMRNGNASTQAASTHSLALPLPLTEQEKLLLRVVQRRDPGSMALLNSDAQRAESARATEQFQHFFAMTPDEMRTQFE